MKNRGQWESADNAASFQSPCPFYAPEPVAPESKYATSMSSSRTGGMGSDSTPSFVRAGTPKSGYYDVSKTAALIENSTNSQLHHKKRRIPFFGMATPVVPTFSKVEIDFPFNF